MELNDVLVLGAGISGLLCAQRLQRAGKQVVVLDKGRGPGGRIATRRFDNGNRFDHGAQFFTVRNERFQMSLNEWFHAGVARQWATGFLQPDLHVHSDLYPRYAGTNGMSAIPRHLALDLTVKNSLQVTELRYDEDAWTAVSLQGVTYRGKQLVLTAPVPQALRLLQTSLPHRAEADLALLDYERCFALMIETTGDTLPAPGGLQIAHGDPVTWMADNYQRGTSDVPGSLTIHSSDAFAMSHWDSPQPDVAALLIEAAKRWLPRTAFGAWQLHRWGFSKPRTQHAERYLHVPELQFAFAGDAFGEPRVEGAALSGLAAADALLGTA